MEKNSIIEKIMLRIDVELPQLTHEKAYGCKMMGLESIDKTTINVQVINAISFASGLLKKITIYFWNWHLYKNI